MQALIVDHMPLVEMAVRLILRHRRLPAHVTAADLKSAARVGLVQAAMRFDAQRGASFKTYAMRRMHGSILDELRDAAPLSRDAWKKYQAGDESVCRYFHDIDSPVVADELRAPEPSVEIPFEDSPLRRLLRLLPPREEKICLLYYRDDLTMAIIAGRLGVNESRISKIHARALRRLRNAMGVNHRG